LVIARYAQNTTITQENGDKTNPLLNKIIGTTLLYHALGAPTIFPAIKLAKVAWEMP